jgi:alternate signal-mediated exported protein
MPKHIAPVDPSVRARKVATWFVATSGIFAVAIAASLLSAGGTFALWNSNRTIQSSQVTGGTAGLTINNVTSYAIAGLDTTKLLPGRSVITASPLTLKNTGTTTLSITPGTVTHTNPALASELVVAITQAATCTLTPSGSTPASFTTPIVLAAGATTTICVEVQLKATAPASVQNQTSTFTAPLTAVQVRP